MTANLRNIGAASAVTCADYDAGGGAGKRCGKRIAREVNLIQFLQRPISLSPA
jgi:hypothetical protein